MGLRMATPWMHPNGTFYLRERVPRDIVTTANKREVVLPMEGQNRIVKLGDGCARGADNSGNICTLGTRSPRQRQLG
jgi:hypothetical protein